MSDSDFEDVKENVEENVNKTKKEPIQLLNEQLDVLGEGIEFLESLKTMKVSVLSVMGPLFSGKSFLCNELVDKFQGGFQVGDMMNQNETCTKGIWIWGEPIQYNDNNILILDVEGFNPEGGKEALEYNKKLFSFCLMISSLIVYNVKREENKTIDKESAKEDLDYFFKIAESVNSIKLEEENEAGIDEKYIPKILWVNRDIPIKDKVRNFNKIYREIGEKNETFEKFFKNKINFTSLYQPSDDENYMALQLYNDLGVDKGKEGSFLPDFLSQVGDLKEQIFNSCTTKEINGIQLNAMIFSSLLQELSGCFICETPLLIKQSFSNVIFANLSEITEQIVDQYREKINSEKMNGIYDQIKYPFDVLTQGKTFLEKYESTYIGKELNSPFLVEQFSTILTCIRDKIYESVKNEVEEYKSKVQKMIENSKDFDNVTSFLSNIKEEINKIFSDDYFIFTSRLKDYFNHSFGEKVSSFYKELMSSHKLQISELEEKNDIKDKLLNDKAKELAAKEETILDLQTQTDNLKRQLEMKEKEYETELEIKGNALKQLQMHKDEVILMKDKEIKQLQQKVQDLNQQVSNYKQEHLETEYSLKMVTQEFDEFKNKSSSRLSIQSKTGESDKDPSNISFEEIYEQIKKVFETYREHTNQLELNTSTVFKTDFCEKISRSLIESTKEIYEKIRQFKDDKYMEVFEIFEKNIDELKEMNRKLSKELIEVNYNLKEEKNKFEVRKIHYEEIQKNFDNYQFLLNKKDELLSRQKEQLGFLDKKYEDLSKDKEDLELKVAKNIGEKKLCEDELESTLDVFRFIFEKEKMSYERGLKKLSEKTRKAIISLNQKYKLIKV